MKTSSLIKIAAVTIAAGFPAVAFAEFAGATVPASVSAENALGVFAFAVIGLTLIADYARGSRPLVAVAPATVPATRAVRSTESHRLAA